MPEQIFTEAIEAFKEAWMRARENAKALRRALDVALTHQPVPPSVEDVDALPDDVLVDRQTLARAADAIGAMPGSTPTYEMWMYLYDRARNIVSTPPGEFSSRPTVQPARVPPSVEDVAEVVDPDAWERAPGLDTEQALAMSRRRIAALRAGARVLALFASQPTVESVRVSPSDEYTPTTAQVRDRYSLVDCTDYATGSLVKRPAVKYQNQFDRWLAAHDAEVRAEAWGEGARWALSDQGYTVDVFVRAALDRHNPYRAETEEHDA